MNTTDVLSYLNFDQFGELSAGVLGAFSDAFTRTKWVDTQAMQQSVTTLCLNNGAEHAWKGFTAGLAEDDPDVKEYLSAATQVRTGVVSSVPMIDGVGMLNGGLMAGLIGLGQGLSHLLPVPIGVVASAGLVGLGYGNDRQREISAERATEYNNERAKVMAIANSFLS
jgi:hypothetical protein